jgi:transcriptional repressor NrdR
LTEPRPGGKMKAQEVVHCRRQRPVCWAKGSHVICPYCAANNDKVIDSRASDAGAVIRRRRECLACQKRFTTYERVEKTARLAVIKRDGSRVPFDPGNVLRGIQAACGKRPIPEAVKLRIAQQIEDEVHREFDREVPSVQIGRRVAARLREVDQIAYIRFASEYYNFRSLEELDAELTELKARPRNLPNQTDLFSEPAPTTGAAAK